MNSVSNLSGQRCAGGLCGVVGLAALLLLAMPAAAQQAAPADQPVATPVTEAGAGQASAGAVSDVPTVVAETTTDAPKEEVAAEETEVKEPPTNEEVLELLRSGNNGKPLTVAQMSAINDMIKRMEFLSDIERKMQSIELGTAGTGTASAATTASASVSAPVPGGFPTGMGGGNDASVLRIIGSKGQYAAVLSTGGQSPKILTVREGDNTDIGQITKVSLNGVVLTGTDGSSKSMPFSTPPGTANLISGR